MKLNHKDVNSSIIFGVLMSICLLLIFALCKFAFGDTTLAWVLIALTVIVSFINGVTK